MGIDSVLFCVAIVLHMILIFLLFLFFFKPSLSPTRISILIYLNAYDRV